MAGQRVSLNLCQPGGKSCGACCGLYNFADHSRQTVTAALQLRTDTIKPLPKVYEAYRDAARSLKGKDPEPLFEAVRVCPMLGFLNEEKTQIGCLAHPMVTGGVELRDCGAFSAIICHTFECPSYIWLSEKMARWVKEGCSDWYLYGLVVTDVEFVRGCLKLLEAQLARPVDLDAVLGSEPAMAATRALFSLKESAPGRAPNAKVFGRFDPDESGEGSQRIIEYDLIGVPPAAEDDVLLCLGYAPTTPEEVAFARGVVHRHIAQLAAALGSG